MIIPDPSPDLEPGDDPFAARLRTHPSAGLPAHWRADILAAASSAVPPPRAPFTRRIAGTWGDFLWPHPAGYAAVGAVWLLILVLRLTTPAAPPMHAPANVAQSFPSQDDPFALVRERLALNEALPFANPAGEGKP